MDDKNAQTQKIGADRSELLANYHKAAGLNPIEQDPSVAAPVDAAAPSDIALPKSDSDVQPVAGKSAEAPVEPSVEVAKPDAKSVEKADEDTLVSKKALDAEREKRKAKTLEARQLSEALSAKDQAIAELQQRMKELESRTVAPAKAGAPVAQDTEVTRQLAEENRRLKEENQKATAKAQAEAQAKASVEFEALVSKTHKELETAGFPGFSDFRVDVAHVLEGKVASGELEVNEITPEHWANAYKEVVYPSKRQIFVEQAKAEKDAAKKALKKNANMARNPGSAPSAPDEEDHDAPQTPESYLKFRQKSLR